MNTSPTPRTFKDIGLDVHGETIAIAIAELNGELRSYGNVPAHSHAINAVCSFYAGFLGPDNRRAKLVPLAKEALSTGVRSGAATTETTARSCLLSHLR